MDAKRPKNLIIQKMHLLHIYPRLTLPQLCRLILTNIYNKIVFILFWILMKNQPAL